MTLCPACGLNVEGDLRAGCRWCGARAVGPPLARPEHELTSYGHATVAFVSGGLMLSAFLGSLIAVLVQNKGIWFRFGQIVTAGEVVAWRLKWVALPVAIAVLWSSGRLIRTIKSAPTRLAGLGFARSGLAAAAMATILVATLIGITVPERLRRHQWAVEAESNARIYTIHRALLEFRDLNGTYPSDLKELDKLPDPNGAIAEALRYIDSNGYQPTTVLASASTKVKPLTLRGAALRNVSTLPNVEAAADHGVSFTNYDLRLAGEDKIMFTDDDLIVHDGMITAVSELPSSTISSRPRTP